MDLILSIVDVVLQKTSMLVVHRAIIFRVHVSVRQTTQLLEGTGKIACRVHRMKVLLGDLEEFFVAVNQRKVLIVFDKMTFDNFLDPAIVDDFGKQNDVVTAACIIPNIHVSFINVIGVVNGRDDACCDKLSDFVPSLDVVGTVVIGFFKPQDSLLCSSHADLRDPRQ